MTGRYAVKTLTGHGSFDYFDLFNAIAAGKPGLAQAIPYCYGPISILRSIEQDGEHNDLRISHATRC